MTISTYYIPIILLAISMVALADGESNSLSVKTLKGFVAVVNENDSAKSGEFIESTYNSYFLKGYSLDSHVAYVNELFRQNGALVIHSIASISDKEGYTRLAAVVMSERTEEWDELILYFEKDKPGKISGIQFKPADADKIPKYSHPISQKEIKNILEQYVKRLEKKGVFSGAVLLANGDKIISSKAAGLADRRFNILNNVRTKFNLGSMNKMFTAIAIMQLVDSGKLSLDDSLSLFVDESWLPKNITNKIQIKHLLSHTSGLGSYFNETYRLSAKDSFRNLEDYKVLIKNDVLSFEPGSKYAYSNTGMFLLGVVIEKASGEDYFDYIRDHIYLKSGMKYSDSYNVDQPVANLATGYLPNDESDSGWQNNNFLLPVKGCPAGGGYSTIEDLHHFVLALINYKLLKKEYVELLFLEKVDLNAARYGFGFQISGDEKNRIVGHGGHFDGVSSNLDIFLDQGYIAIVLSNQSDGATPIVHKIRWLLSNMKKT